MMYLGIDIGTSAVKAVIADENGDIRADASAPLEVSRPRADWSEQDPEAWWEATCAAVKALPAPLRQGIRAASLSGQMHGATLLDARDRVLRPAILWNDGRSGRECAELETAVPQLGDITGNRAMPGFTAPKLAWVRRHEPQVFSQVDRVLLPKDFIRLRMTGEAASDLSDAAGTLWLDVKARDWSDAMLDATGLTTRQMPRLVEGTGETGTLRSDCAAAWGVPAVPVYGGGGDNAAGAIGAGVVRDGEALLSLGTSGVLFLANDAYRPAPQGGVHCFCHAVPDRWHQMSVILSAASCLEWAAKACGCSGAAELMALVEADDRPSGEELFLPYLSGERTPHNDPRARGVLFGLSHDTTPARIGRAVLEGVAFAFRDGLDALRDAGSTIGNVSVIGGGSRSTLWGRILASALDTPLGYRDGARVGAAAGAARLAFIGHTSASVDAACTPPRLLQVLEPDPELVSHSAERMPRYRALYHALKPSFRGPHHD
ncbi:MAG: Xylulose kinase [Pseudomonadota bacterium]|jgi:xylulokinase